MALTDFAPVFNLSSMVDNLPRLKSFLCGREDSFAEELNLNPLRSSELR